MTALRAYLAALSPDARCLLALGILAFTLAPVLWLALRFIVARAKAPLEAEIARLEREREAEREHVLSLERARIEAIAARLARAGARLEGRFAILDPSGADEVLRSASAKGSRKA